MWGPFSTFVRPYRKTLSAGLLALVIAQACAALIPLRLEKAVDSIVAVRGVVPVSAAGVVPVSAEKVRSREEIERYALQIMGLALLVAGGRYLMRRLFGFTSNRIEYDIRGHYFAHLLKLPLSYFQKHHTGDLMSRATNDLISVHVFFTYCLRSLVDSSLSFLFSLTFMCTLNWQLTVIVLAPLPILCFCVLRMSPLVHSRFKGIQEFFGQMSNFIQENLSGIRVVKAYVQGPPQISTFAGLNQTYLEKNQTLIRTRAIYYPVFFLMASVGLGLTLWFGGKAVVAGEMELGAFVAFNAYLTMLIRPFAFAGWMIDRTQRALVAMRRINEVVNVVPEIADDGRSSASDGEMVGQVSFRDLHFSYGGTPVINGIDLDIPAGTTVGIIGRVGSGKTTLARLIPRLVEASAGAVLIDGRSVESWPLDQLRQAIGYVSQSPFLFSDSIGANIGYGVENTGDDEYANAIATAAEQAQIGEDAHGFEDGFATVVGERGVTLSGGQKQRVTLARAVIRKPRILILDDALSAVDTHTEEAILGHLKQIMQGRTTIIIAHRISTLRDTDHIIVLDEGRIVEQGDHQALLQQRGIYQELYRRQQLAAELESL